MGFGEGTLNYVRARRIGVTDAYRAHTPVVVGATPTSATIYGGDSSIVELLIVTQ